VESVLWNDNDLEKSKFFVRYKAEFPCLKRFIISYPGLKLGEGGGTGRGNLEKGGRGGEYTGGAKREK